jgi:hypothetical protein
MLVLAFLLSVLFPSVATTPLADAAEARCTELGANCVCSEPLQMTGYTVHGSYSGWLNPNDTSTKECNGEGDGVGVGYAIVNGGGTSDSIVATAGSDSAVFAALPAGHSLTRVLRNPEAHVGLNFIGHTFPGVSTYAKRVAVRFYRYYSGNGGTNAYAFDDDPAACNANKLMQLDGHPSNSANMIFDNGFGPTSLYNFLTFQGGTGSQDCCGFGGLIDSGSIPQATLDAMSGPSITGVSPYYQYYRGKWIRYELIVTNRNSGTTSIPVTFKLYVKNVTDNGPEYKIVDSCTTTGTNTLTTPCGHIPLSSVEFNKFLMNNFRQDTCPGFSAYSHYMLAGWDTDAGQRIGAASEIEGGLGASRSSAIPGGSRFPGSVVIR